jgi:integrase
MASLSKDKGKRGVTYRVLFKAADGQRKPIRLGPVTAKQAATILAHFDQLERCLIDGSAPPTQTAAWLAEISDTLRAKLVAHKLAAPKAAPVIDERPTGPTLAELVEAFKDRPKWRDKKPTTRTNYELHFRHILAGLGADTPVADVTETEAEDLHGYLGEAKPKGAGLCRASANRFCDTASMLFRFAVRSRLVGLNPFEEVKRGVVASANKTFVDAPTSRLVIDAMKNSQWRLLVALARWGGLRCPSEPRMLRWGDIDRERNRMTVRSPKTEHHHGHESREVPLFPELVPYIDARFAEAEPGEFVLPMMQALGCTAYRTQLDRTVRKLKLDRWPRIFHSLRATRQTELEQIYPSYVVCKWMGNSEIVARKHYLQVTDDHFATAARIPAQQAAELPRMAVND